MSRRSNRRSQRDTSDIANETQQLLRPRQNEPSLTVTTLTRPVNPYEDAFFSPLTETQDLRQWTPEVEVVTGVPDVLRTLAGTPASFSDAPKTRSVSARTASRPLRTARQLAAGSVSRVVGSYGFTRPDTALLCLRRQTRKEVLHALKRTRRGSGGSKKWTWKSKERC